MADHGNLICALVAGASDLLQQMSLPADLWACLFLQYETLDGAKAWLVDPSFEESCNLSNNLVLVAKIGQKVMVQVGADMNRSSYSHHNSATLSYKPSSLPLRELRECIVQAE